MADQRSPHDLERLADLRLRIAELQGQFETTGLNGHDTTAETLADFTRHAEAIEQAWDDKRLMAAYQQTNGEPGNREADAILAEIKHRNLDI